MIEFECCHRFGEFSLDVSLTAQRGISVLFGRSGSGKSSVINIMAGLEIPENCFFRVNGRVLTDTSQGISVPVSKRRIGYIFQEGRLFPHMTVQKNLTYSRRFLGRGMSEDEFDKIVDVLGLSALLDRRPYHLSGGEKQRVAIGRALLSQPTLLLADEPLTALDAERKSQLLPVFEQLRDIFDIPIIYVSHSANEVARLADTVVAMQNGTVLRQGRASDILSDLNVLPLGPSEAGAVLLGNIVGHSDDGLTELRIENGTVFVPQIDRPLGEKIRIRIQAQDVMLSVSQPYGISALNVLPVTINDIRLGDGNDALVQLSIGEQTIVSRITKRSASALDLTKGQKIFAVAKSVSIDRMHMAR